MQCDNCGYIFFQPSKKCACCSAPYAPSRTAFDVGQENLFTIFEMAPGEGGMAAAGSMAVAEAGVGVEDYNFTDDFDMGEVEYGVDENVLDLSEAEAEGFGSGSSTTAPSIPAASADDFDYDSAGMGGMAAYEEEIGPDDFELDLSESTASQAYVSDDAASMETIGSEYESTPDVSLDLSPAEEGDVSLDLSPAEEGEEAGAALDPDFGGSGFDSEVEGLGFGFDETPGEEEPEVEAATDEISLDEEPEIEAELSLEPELELTDEESEDEESSLELSEDEDDGISMELSEDGNDGIPMELSDEEPDLEMGDTDGEDIVLSDETDYEALTEDSGDYEDDEEDAGGIDFDLDSVDLDAPEEEASLDEEPEAMDTGEEPSLEVEGMELEMESPDEPEEEENP